jgi:hypothetical protein
MEWALSLLPGDGPYRERGSKMDDQNFDVAALFEVRIKNAFQATPGPPVVAAAENRRKQVHDSPVNIHRDLCGS